MDTMFDQTRDPLIATQSEALIAREALPRLKSVAQAGADIRIRVLGADDIVVPLPAVAVRIIVGLLAAMAEGKPVSLIPTDAELTTQQAADMLNVSRPHLVKLLLGGEIPFHQVGTHRRLKVADLLVYKARSREQREAAIEKMVSLSQELGLD